MTDKDDLYYKELQELVQEHHDLNEIIDNENSCDDFSEFTLQKLKKRKLLVKDKIDAIKRFLSPDIIA